MKKFTLFFGLFLCLSVTIGLRAQDPGAQQDAEAAREKLLKAADELDNIQANSESTRQAVEAMKGDIVKLQADVTGLQTENAALKQQLADQQAAFDKSEADHAKERQVLLDSIAGMIASSAKAKPGVKKKTPSASASSSPAPAKTTNPAPDSGSTPPSTKPDGDATAQDSTSGTTDATPAKTQKGYYHIVASGETLTLISNAYREEGVAVSVTDIENANGLTEKSVLKVGQKLFIPKPGT